MIKSLNEGTYDFVDSILYKIELDDKMFDFIFKIDYYIGKDESTEAVLKLEDVKQLNYFMSYCGTKDDKWSPYTLGYITVKKNNDLFEVAIESSEVIDSTRNVEPIVLCLCKNVTIESNVELNMY